MMSVCGVGIGVGERWEQKKVLHCLLEFLAYAFSED